MIILSVTLVPFFHNAASSPRTSTWSAASTRRRARSRRSCSCCRAAMSTGVVISAPAVVLSVVLGLSVTSTCLLIGLPTAFYTMFGGVQAVAWTDVKQMVLIVGGLLAAVVVLVVGLPDDVSSATRCTSPAPPGACRRSTSASTSPSSTPSGRAPSPRCSCSVVLRHRPEPGAALPHRQVGGRGAHVAADERLLEDPAPGAGAAHRRVDVRVLPVHAAADALQPRARRAGAGSARAGDYAAVEARFDSAHERRSAAAARPSGAAAGDPAQADAAARVPAAEAEVRACVPRRWRSWRRRATATYNDVNYVFPTFVTHAHAGGARRPAHRGDLRRRDVDDLGRARVAVDRDGDRLLSPLCGRRRRRRAPPVGVARWPPASGACSRASSPSGRRSSARSSRWSTASARSSTARSSACSSWHRRQRATGNGAFVGLLAGMATVRLRRDLHQGGVPLAQRRRRAAVVVSWGCS